MHDTAFQIGALAMDIYADLATASVLEVGSQAFNGSLRDKAFPSTNYVGLDLEAGEGVDLVVEPSQPFPIETGTFDLVIASSVFEHDPCFWLTFMEMCRVTKDGGFIYVNAPSNGIVHRYPQDNWRFYPDAGRALEKWAISQGFSITLIESFIADREADIWNDFVAVFRKGRVTKLQPATFLHEHLPSVNVTTWKSKKMLRPREETQDRILLHEATLKADEAEGRCDQLKQELERSQQHASRLTASEDENNRLTMELKRLETELGQKTEAHSETIEDRARKAEALSQAEARAEMLGNQLKELIGVDRRQRREIAQLQDELRDRDNDLHRLRMRSDRELSILTDLVRQAEKQVAEAKGELDQAEVRVIEATLKLEKVAELEKKLTELRDFAVWNDKVLVCLSAAPGWWRFLPKGWRSRREEQRLRSAGLFDSSAYYTRYPDVAVEGFEALNHYRRHGILEGRSRDNTLIEQTS